MNMKRYKVEPIFCMDNKKANGKDEGSRARSIIFLYSNDD